MMMCWEAGLEHDVCLEQDILHWSVRLGTTTTTSSHER
jgi:hypothetical protein